MKPDDIIQQAMGGTGKLIGGSDAYIPKGHPERNEFSIKTADEVYKDNMIAFAWKLQTGYLFLDMYTTREAADETITFIRTLLRDEEGKTLLCQPGTCYRKQCQQNPV